MAALSPSASQQEGDPAVRRCDTCELPLAPRLILLKTSLVPVHVQGVYQPTVHADTERVIGCKRSTDGCAHSPRQDSDSGNSALRIGGGSYERPALQRFRACAACLACLVSFGFPLQICQSPRNLSSVPPASSRDTIM